MVPHRDNREQEPFEGGQRFLGTRADSLPRRVVQANLNRRGGKQCSDRDPHASALSAAEPDCYRSLRVGSELRRSPTLIVGAKPSNRPSRSRAPLEEEVLRKAIHPVTCKHGSPLHPGQQAQARADRHQGRDRPELLVTNVVARYPDEEARSVAAVELPPWKVPPWKVPPWKVPPWRVELPPPSAVSLSKRK